MNKSHGSLTITRGLPGSGKSYYAKAWLRQGPFRKEINRDDIRMALYGAKKDLTREQENQVTSFCHSMAGLFLSDGFEVIVSDTNLRRRYVDAWQKIAERFKVPFSIIEMPLDVNKAIFQDAYRRGEDKLGDEVIRKLYDRYCHDNRYE